MHDVDNYKTTTRAQYPRGLLDGMLSSLGGPDVVDRQAGGAAQPGIGQPPTGAVVAYEARAPHLRFVPVTDRATGRPKAAVSGNHMLR
jgi:hypothetical protein